MTKKVAVVKFPYTDRFSGSYGKNYNFLTDIEDLKMGDKVVVDTVNGLQVADFIKYDEYGFGEVGKKRPTKWVIQLIDLEKHKIRVEAALEAERLKRLLEEERKKAQELEIYEILAKTNPQIAEYLEKLKKLQEVL